MAKGPSPLPKKLRNSPTMGSPFDAKKGNYVLVAFLRLHGEEDQAALSILTDWDKR